jgi:hypothetical protein
LVGKIISDDGAKMTVAGRRKRFAIGLHEALKVAGWTTVSGTTVHTFEKLGNAANQNAALTQSKAK